MDPNYAIDPSLQEAEGTIHTAPATSPPRGQDEDVDGQHAPVAHMQSSPLAQETYNNMLPLIQAAEQAREIARYSNLPPNEYYAQARQDGEPAAAALDGQQGKPLKAKRKGKTGRGPGRPKKNKDAPAESVDPTPRAVREESVDSVLGPAANEAVTNIDGTVDDGAETTAAKPKRKSKKRSRKDAALDEGGGGEAVNVDETPNKKPRKPEIIVDENGLTEKDTQMREAGPLSKLEWRKLEAVIEEFKASHELDQAAVNELVQNTTRAQSTITKELWKDLYEALEHRQHVAVMRACRRRFNNFEARGKWTTEEDDMLRQTYAENPGKWVKIGGTLGRMPEDCRDRWRNYLSCGNQRRIDDWTTKEELDLRKIVADSADRLKQDAKAKAKEEGHAFREQDWESQVNFNKVSEAMGFTRSRLQCYTHWRVMNNRDPSIHGSVRKSEGASNRQGRALANFKKMLPGDKYQILRFIADSSAQEDEEIPWKQIARENPNNRWSTRDRKEAFIKMKADLASGHTELRPALDALLNHFRTAFPNQLDDLTPPLDPTQKRVSDEFINEDDAEGGVDDGGEGTAGNQISIDEVNATMNGETPDAQPSADAAGQSQAAVAQMLPPAAKKPKKPRKEKSSKKSKNATRTFDEESNAMNTGDPTDVAGVAAAVEEARQEAGAESGSTLAQKLLSATSGFMSNPYQAASKAHPSQAMDIDEPQQAAGTQDAEHGQKRKKGKSGRKKKHDKTAT